MPGPYVVTWRNDGAFTAMHHTDYKRKVVRVLVYKTVASAERALDEYWHDNAPMTISHKKVMDVVQFAIENPFDWPVEYRYRNYSLVRGPNTLTKG